MNMMKRIAIVCLALSLLLCACAGGKSLPTSAAADPASNVASAASDVMSAASEAISTATEAIGKGVYDDRLIRDCLLGEGVVPPDGGAGPYDYRLPEILSDTPDAREINAEIDEQIGAAVETSLTAIENDSIPPFRRIGWTSGWNDSVVSLLIEGEADASFTDYSVYHYDFATGKRLTDEELAARLGYEWGDVIDAVRRASADAVDRLYLASSDINTYDGSYPLQRVYAASGFTEETATGVYLDQNGSLCALAQVNDPNSGEWRYRKLPLDFSEQRDLPEASEGFVSAKMTDGVITVTFGDTEEADMYLGALSEEPLERTITAEGFWGRYERLFVGTIGQDTWPYLFALRTDGGLEFADLFRGYKAGKVYSAGLLPGVRNVVGVEGGPSAGGDYYTQYAVTRTGQRIDLSDAVDVMGWDFHESLRGSWSAEVEHPVASGNSYQSSYSLDIGGDGSLQFDSFLPEMEITLHSQGGVHYVGCTDGGLIVEYWLTDDGNEGRSGTFRLEPGTFNMYLHNVGGTALFDSAVETTMLVRAYG